MLLAIRSEKLPLKGGSELTPTAGYSVVMDDTGDQLTKAAGDIISQNGVARLPYLINASKTVNNDVKRMSTLAMGYVGSLVGSNLFFGFLKKSPVFMALFHELPTLLFTMFSAFRAKQIASGIDTQLEGGGQAVFESPNIVEGIKDAWDIFNVVRKNGLGIDADENIVAIPSNDQAPDAGLAAAHG